MSSLINMNSFLGRDLISISDLSKTEIETILDLTEKLKRKELSPSLQGKILACCFFEPSTRTRLSFEAAMHRLGGSVIGFSDLQSTSIQKGESLSDTLRVIGDYADVIVLRHPAEGSARVAANAVEIPVINAGDGANQHPSQTLLDLFTIKELQGKISGLTIGLAGDLKYARTIHSLAIGLSHYGVRIYFLSPPELQLPEEIAGQLRKAGVKFSYHEKISEVLPKLDILYMTRIQKERHHQNASFEFCLNKPHLSHVKSSFRILSPLPRVQAIDPSIDTTPYASYFTQSANGVFVRKALLSLILGAL